MVLRSESYSCVSLEKLNLSAILMSALALSYWLCHWNAFRHGRKVLDISWRKMSVTGSEQTFQKQLDRRHVSVL